ncbi:MAG: SpoIID/LytB domain-containing protein [Lachnospiraceae bacterium]|nr:SpoIID/LytB domain-containing protein [Lachnospiraceae bacterium]
MKRHKRIYLIYAAAIFLLPCILVLAFGPDAKSEGAYYDGRYTVNVGGEAVDSERFLVWALAGYVEPDYETECLKAMAVVLRTNLRKALGGRSKISADELGFAYYTEEELEKIWGDGDFVGNYRKLENAVIDTDGAVILNGNGYYIDALFHRVSAGRTRDGAYFGEDYTYLSPVESKSDINSPDYMQLVIYDEATVKRLLSETFHTSFEPKVKPLAQEIILQNEDGDYVEKVTICGREFCADEIAKALKLQSPAFVVEEYKSKMRFLVSGIGHGFGLSIYGSNVFAGEGYGFKEILNYYYANIIIKYE